MDSNWTEPWLFIVYSIVKPIAGAFILVLMYAVFVIISGARDPALFDFFYVGNSFFIFVAATLFGTFQVIQSDREWYQTIRYVYISPISYYMYILGRAVSKVLVAAVAVFITLLVGVVFLEVHINLALANVPALILSLILGIASLLSLGICLAGVSFLTARHTHGLAEGLPGLFYVFCGVLFPLAVLPAWGQGFALGIPLTYWFEMSRRVLAPQAFVDPVLAGYSDGTILLILAISALGFFLLSLGVFKATEYLARKAGKIDMLTSY